MIHVGYMAQFALDKNKTALVVIDLQKGVTAAPARPYPAQEVIKNAQKLVNAFRRNRMPVFLVHVKVTEETRLRVISDESFPRSSPMPLDWSEFVPEIAPTPSDIVIAKRQWGAFYGTDLELQLRRRGIDTLVLCGISTDYGVESTARFAYEYGFQQIFAEDAMTARSDEQHHAAVNFIFRRMGRVRKTDEIIEYLQ
jgi:nicotinamidase-related amidase